MIDQPGGPQVPKINEKTIQSSLMSWLMDTAQHTLALPNPTTIILWEADLISLNRAGLVTEYEIKISKGDYRKDKKKIEKLQLLTNAYNNHLNNKKHTAATYGRLTIPNYFYYVTHGFDIDPPPWAGWISIQCKTDHGPWSGILHGTIKKTAPRLHVGKIDADQIKQASKLLSYRLMQAYKIAHPYFIERKTK